MGLSGLSSGPCYQRPGTLAPEGLRPAHHRTVPPLSSGRSTNDRIRPAVARRGHWGCSLGYQINFRFHIKRCSCINNTTQPRKTCRHHAHLFLGIKVSLTLITTERWVIWKVQSNTQPIAHCRTEQHRGEQTACRCALLSTVTVQQETEKPHRRWSLSETQRLQIFLPWIITQKHKRTIFFKCF